MEILLPNFHDFIFFSTSDFPLRVVIVLGPVVRPLELPRTSKSIVFVTIIPRPPNKQSVDLRIGADISVVSTFLIEHNALLMSSEIKVMPSHMIFQYNNLIISILIAQYSCVVSYRNNKGQ